MASSLAQAWVPAFGAPALAIAGAVAVAIPVAIHLFSRRPRRPVPWGAMQFLLAAYRRHRMRVRAEQWLLLLLRCLLVALLGMALAQPVLSELRAVPFGGAGRTFVLVVDNGVTSGARRPDGSTRLERLKEVAGKLLATMGPSDRAALVRAARPAKRLVAPATSDTAAVRSRLEEVAPSAAASDLPAALRIAKDLLQGRETRGHAFVVLLSDFSRGAVPLDEPLASELQRLGDLATLLRPKPADPLPNVQIASMEPDRRVVVPTAGEGEKPVVRWTIKLRRLSGQRPAATDTLRVERPGKKPVKQTVQWEADQKEQSVKIATAVSGEGPTVATASVRPADAKADTLAVDNERAAVVVVEPRLRVWLAGGGAVGSGTDAPALSPRQWVRAALRPGREELSHSIELRTVASSAVREKDALRAADVLFILRPDRVGKRGLTAVRRWVADGGLAWVFPPATEGGKLWQKRLETLGVQASVALEPAEPETPLRLPADQPATAELKRLERELPSLLRPIRVHKHLPIDSESVGDADVLLKAEGGKPLLVAAPVGRGRVVLSATAVDPRWTNLPTKPLFVPLLHEGIRAGLDRLQPERAFEPGDRPVLGPRWEGSTRLDGPDGETVLLVEPEGADAKEAGVATPTSPLRRVGTYRGSTAVLVVNPRAEAADTRATDPAALGEWLGTAGEWTVFGSDGAETALRAETAGVDLGWPLLWAALAVALLETLVARWISHARTAGEEATPLSAGRNIRGTRR